MKLSAVLAAVLFSPILVHAHTLDRSERAKIDEYIQRYYTGLEILASFHDAAGKSFDCIPRERQPSLRRIDPQTGRQSFDKLALPANDDRLDAEIPGIPRGCPVGAAAVESIAFDDIAQYGSLEAYLQRYHISASASVQSGGPVALSSSVGSAHAVGRASLSGSITGASVEYLDWSGPSIQNSSFASTGAISVWGYGSGGGASSYSAAQAGWQKYPDRTGVSHSVFFVNATRMNWLESSCYGGCGWVQLSGTIGPGFSNPFSSIAISIEYNGGYWYLYAAGQTIGYWNDFSGTFGSGVGVGADVGGYVGGPYGVTGAPRTTTDMGNGLKAGNTGAAKARNVRARNASNVWQTPSIIAQHRSHLGLACDPAGLECIKVFEASA